MHGTQRLQNILEGWVDELFHKALPGLEKLGFSVSRPDKYGPQVYVIQAESGSDVQDEFKPEEVVDFWNRVKDKKRMSTQERKHFLSLSEKHEGSGVARLEKEMMIFTGNEEEDQSFAFKVHPADQIRAEKFLKAKQWEYTISKEELANGYVTVTVPNNYVFMDKKLDYRDMARMMSEHGIRVLKDRDMDNGHEVVKVAEKKKRGWQGLRPKGKFSKDELDFYW